MKTVTGSVQILTRPGAALGFSLAGVPVHEADDASGAQRHLETLTDDRSVAVVLVEASLLESLRPALKRRLQALGRPLVLSFPVPPWRETGVEEAEAAILEILRQAVGYRIRLP